MPQVKSIIVVALFVSSGLFGFDSPAAAQNDKRAFKAGASMSNITPPLGELIVGGWRPMPATHIHDELYAKCLVLDDGTTKLAIVLCDNVGIPQVVFDHAKQRASKATGIPASRMLLASTHTHSATTARGPSKVVREDELTDYQQFLVSRISDGIRRAVNQLEPAHIGWGAVDEPSEVFNRRWFVKDDKLSANPFGGTDRVRMNPPRGSDLLDKPAGPIDPQVSFISVRSVDGRPIALLANYSLHYVGGVKPGDVSADYFGYFATYIAKHLGAAGQKPAFVTMLSNGTSGDINNINFTAKTRKRYERYEKMQEVARKVADRVAAAHSKVEFKAWVPLAAAYHDLPLKVRRPTPAMLEYLDRYLSDKPVEGKPRHSREPIYAMRIARLKNAPDVIEVPLQVVRIGDLGIAAIPFETFAETGLELKKKGPFAQTFTIELANGSFGYLPTPRQHDLGGYETWLGTNYVERHASEKIVAKLLEMFETLHNSSKPAAASR